MSDSPFLLVVVKKIAYITNMGYLLLLCPQKKSNNEEEEQVLPICMGPAEAQSIAVAFNAMVFSRPITHDLFRNVLEDLGCEVTQVQITELRDGTFYARLFIRQASGEIRDVDARPSDAIGIALRYQAPIYVHEAVMAEAGITVKQMQLSGMNDWGGGEEEQAEPAPPHQTPEERLSADLKRAVAEERYEDAARIRDQLQGLRKN